MADVVCKGSWILGTACGQCSRCVEDLPRATAYVREHMAEIAEWRRMKDSLRDNSGAFVEVVKEQRTLRDWFAGQVLAGILAGAEVEMLPQAALSAIPKVAYALADEMLAARKNGDG